MKYSQKHLKRTKHFKKSIAVTLLVLIVATIAVTIFAFTAIQTSDPIATQDEIEPMTLGVRLVTDEDWGTTTPTTSPTIPTTEPTESSNSIISTQNDKVKPTDDVIETVAPTEHPTEQVKETEPYTYLIEIDNPDKSYTPTSITLSNDERELAANVVMREFGDGGYNACCLQAQAIRDAMLAENYSLQEVLHNYQYDVYSTNYTPNDNCYQSVDFIFGEGGLAVPHRVLYMYSTLYTYSSWHESQQFIVEYQGVRFFDRWW